MKKFFTKIMKLFYKYDSRYTIVKNEEFKHGKTIVWSVDHSWNSVEWCLPGLYYLKKHYNINLVFLAGDTEIWQRCLEESYIYSLLKDTFNVIIINTLDISKCNWIQRKVYRLKKSLLEKISMEFFFKNISVDILLGLPNPSMVYKYFKKYQKNTIIVGYEHGTCYKIALGDLFGKLRISSDEDYHLCADDVIYDLNERLDNKIIKIGVPQFDNWWRSLIYRGLWESKKIDRKDNKIILVLLPHMINKDRWYSEDRENLIKVLQYFYGKERIMLKFHPREMQGARGKFVRDIINDDIENEIIVTTMPTECISKIADCVIVVGDNSAAGAAVINDVPVIEFHCNKAMPSFYLENGQYGTLLKVKNAIMSADDYNTLKNSIKGVLYNNAWNMYLGKYKEYISTDNKASQRFAEELIQLLHY